MTQRPLPLLLLAAALAAPLVLQAQQPAFRSAIDVVSMNVTVIDSTSKYITDLTEKDFEKEVLVSELPVLVEFGATWCGPCKVVEPELQALAQEYAGRAKVLTVDIDASPFLARQLGIPLVDVATEPRTTRA
jgi:thioredoxin-like negative regulator of GroEL